MQVFHRESGASCLANPPKPVRRSTHPSCDSRRPIAIASILTVAINAIIPYTHHYLHTISLVEGMMPMGVLMPFLLLIFVVNPLLKLVGKGIQLEPWELIIVFSVSYVSVHINELLGRVLATYAVMHYMAAPRTCGPSMPTDWFSLGWSWRMQGIA